MCTGMPADVHWYAGVDSVGVLACFLGIQIPGSWVLSGSCLDPAWILPGSCLDPAWILLGFWPASQVSRSPGPGSYSSLFLLITISYIELLMSFVDGGYNHIELIVIPYIGVCKQCLKV